MIDPTNKQGYANSPLRFLLDDEEIAASTEQLFNRKDPNLAIMHEKPEHRVILWMKIRGASNHDIAQTLDYSEAWISQIVRQPWAQKYMLAEMREGGVDELTAILKGAAADSIYKLIDLRDDDDAPKSVQQTSAIALLDRFMGKPIQRVEAEVTQTLDISTVEKIDEQLAVIKQQEDAILGSRNN